MEIPKELRLETYERRKFSATMDHMGLTVEVIPGAEGRGAIVKGFIDAISLHDDMVKNVEDQTLALKNIRREFTKKNRMYRNLDGAWNTFMSDHQEDFEEFKVLAPKMVGMEERLERITDAKAKIKAEADWNRFKELEPLCIKLDEVQTALDTAREERDVVQARMLEIEGMLARSKTEEKKLADNITDDHIIACEKGKNIAHIFPNVQANYVLYSLNKTYTETLDFKEIKNLIKKEKPPHNVIFCRYDYRYDPFYEVWRSLNELRNMGVCIDDPMISKAEFVSLAASGDFNAVKEVLLRGEDPNCKDYTGATALHAAAANKHQDCIELLHRAGAKPDVRDANLLTPMLTAVMKGHLAVVRQLLEMNCDREARDKNQRNALYFAMTSGNASMVNFFVNNDNVNEAEQLWGFTPMHTAANLGNLPLVEQLLSFGGSIYKKDLQGRTAEDVAREAQYRAVVAHLELERYSAPAQLCHKDVESGLCVWVGEFGALDPVWSTDVGITEVITLTTTLRKPSNMDWLTDDEECKHLTCLVDAEDDDESEGSFVEFQSSLAGALTHLLALMKKGDAQILVCDPSGVSTAPALLAVALLLRHQTPITTTLAHIGVARPALKMSKSLRRGLEIIQTDFNDKKMKRLDAKIRHAVVLSNGF